MFVPGKLFQPSLMFVDKAGAYPSEVKHIYGALLEGRLLTLLANTRLEKLARDKLSSLLPKFVNCRQKSFITWVPELGRTWCQSYKPFFFVYVASAK